jgi:ubiquinone/menaquinone biosynthesis C-methylase UbiE
MTDQALIDGWQIDTEGAWNYERFLVPAVFDPWAAALVEAIGIGAGDRVLDLACGTGIVARHAAERTGARGQVTGVDVNPAMLEVAREVSADTAPAIAWEQASAAELPFPDDSFDVVACQQGLQFFPDRTRALAEIRRVTAPGRRIGLSTCGSVERQPGYRALTDVLLRHVGVSASEVISTPYQLGDPDELRALIVDAGLRDPHLRRAYTEFRTPSAEALIRGEASSSPLGDIFADLDDDVRVAVIDDLAGELAAHSDDDGVIFPFETLMVTARA